MTYQSTGVAHVLRVLIVGHCLLLLLLPLAMTTVQSPCPASCHCRQTPAVTISCVSSNFTELPPSLPVLIDTLDFSGNRLASLSAGLLADTVTIVTFNVSRNKIEVIASGAFRQFSSLTSVDLSDNRLSTIDQGTFEGESKTAINNLDLSSNRLTDIDGAFSGMVNLSRLDLRNNFITALTEFTLRDLTNLRYLFLTNNRIYTIDKRTFRSLPSLLYLVLKGNPLHDVTRFYFYSPSSLSYIDLSECSLSQVPGGLPVSMRYLQMRRNNITTLASGAFGEFPDVNILVLDENRIETVEIGSISGLRRLQQLWLNDNRLTQIPSALPISLRRLLIDNNQITRLDNDSFSTCSELNTLSLVGNRIQDASRQTFRRAVNLQSLDLSNNQLRVIAADLFSANSKLRALHLSKNPLDELGRNIFGNLSSLKALSLSYLSSVSLTVADDLLRPLTSLQRLDVDNSPSFAQSLVKSNQLDQLDSLQELGLVNSDLRSLPVNWPVLSRIAQLRLSSGHWHCDENLKWFRDWLLNPVNSRKFDHRPQDIRCATPVSLHGKALVSLADLQFQPAEAPPPVPTTTTSGLVSTTELPQRTAFGDLESTRAAGEEHGEPTIDFNAEEKKKGKEVNGNENEYKEEEEEEEDDDDDDIYDGDDVIDSPEDSVITFSENDNHKASSTVSGADHTITAVALDATEEDDDLEKLKVQIIIAGSTVGATLLIITIIVAAIVRVCRHQRRPLANTSEHKSGRTFIKYENKNGVLYFSTPADTMEGCPEVDQRVIVSHVQTVVDKKGADESLQYLVPAGNSTPATPLTPSSYNKTRVYRWEDF